MHIGGCYLHKVSRQALAAVGVVVGQGGGEPRHSQASIDGLQGEGNTVISTAQTSLHGVDHRKRHTGTSSTLG